MSAPIFPAEKMDQLLGLLIPDDVRKEGGIRLQECLRKVFDLAAQIGHQQWASEKARAREEGFEAGRKEGLREQQARPYSEASASPSRADSVSVAIQTETQLSTPIPCPSCSRSLTEPVPPCSPKSDAMPTHSSPPLSHPVPELPLGSPPALPPADDEDLNAKVWHEVPESPPHPSSPSPSPLTFTRDFSDLRTGTSRPFASLQRRHRRAPCAPGPRPSSPRSSRAPHTIVLNIYDSRSKKPRARYAVPPLSTPAPHSNLPAPTCNRISDLDWGHDPRLRDLSRALTALGWVRPG